MRISGRRADGALNLAIGSGMAVVLKGYYVTPPMEADAVDAMGPWEPADNSFDERQRVERLLNIASLTNMEYFMLGGAGSGNFGHSGRPGQEGGSGGGGGGESKGKATATLVKKSLGRLLDESAKEQGISMEPTTTDDGRLVYKIGDTHYTPGEAADKLGVKWGQGGGRDDRFGPFPEAGAGAFAHKGRAAGPAGNVIREQGELAASRAAYQTKIATRAAHGKEDTELAKSRAAYQERIAERSGHKGRASSRGGSLSTDFVEQIINAAKDAAHWHLSDGSEMMQQNIDRNAAYRRAVPSLSVRVMCSDFYVTDADLFTVADDLSDDDVVVLAAAFGIAKKAPVEEEVDPAVVEDVIVKAADAIKKKPKKKGEAVALDDTDDDKKKPVSEVAAPDVLNLQPKQENA